MRTSPSVCNRKKTFATREAAARVAAKAPFKLRAYKCELCGKYHLTGRTKGMKTPRWELERQKAQR